MSLMDFLHHMVQELKAELLSGRIQKINQPFEQELVLQIRGNRKIKNSCSQPILSLDGFNGPRPTLKILPSQYLYYGYAQISSRRCHRRD